MKKRTLILAGAVLAAALAITACKPKPGRGFVLPKGDAEKGKAAFVALQCHTCHTVDGVELPKPASPATNILVVGGAVAKIKTFGELVTAVINPSHEFAAGFDKTKLKEGGLSPMPDYTETMTVRQMTDIVTFLQAHYTQLVIEPTYSPYYHP